MRSQPAWLLVMLWLRAVAATRVLAASTVGKPKPVVVAAAAAAAAAAAITHGCFWAELPWCVPVPCSALPFAWLPLPRR